MASRTRVALLGAGFIADVHLLVLRRLRGVRVVAVCDAVAARAESLARRHGVERSFESLDKLLQWGQVDCVHVLVPPDLHLALTRQCLEAGLHVLVEKPMALGTAQAAELGQLAEAQGLVLGVNHNATFLPGMARLKRELTAGRLGKLEHLSLVHRAPLRQLEAGQFGHFMFRTEANILWEQGVHLFSVVHQFLGPCRDLQVELGEPRRLPTGMRFMDRWMMNLVCAGGTAQVHLELGCHLAETSLQAFASDGSLRMDLLRGSYQRVGKTRWPDGFDRAANLTAQGAGLLRQGLGAMVDYGRSQLRLGGAEPFLRAMKSSLGSFHDALRRGVPPPCDAQAAVEVLAFCETAIQRAGLSTLEGKRDPLPEPGPARPGEVVITGGTGTLGKPVVRTLLQADRPVTLLVRRPELLSEELRAAPIRVFAGDALNSQAVRRALQGASYALHMATCAGEDPDGVEESMVEGVRIMGEAALSEGLRRMVFVSSTAALYLGGSGTVTGATAPDPRPRSRPAYARGKIAAEAELRRLQEEGLEGVVLRPAIVLGGSQHGGLGLWVRDIHCLGWGTGAVPLPLVLARDCAQAIVSSLDADGIGGRSYLVAGDLRLTAAEFVRELRRRTGRPYRFHPQPLALLWCMEMLKYAVKVLTRRPGRQLPSWRDLRSRGFLATLDCRDTQRDLGWQPETDRQEFLSAAIGPVPGAER